MQVQKSDGRCFADIPFTQAQPLGKPDATIEDLFQSVISGQIDSKFLLKKIRAAPAVEHESLIQNLKTIGMVSDVAFFKSTLFCLLRNSGNAQKFVQDNEHLVNQTIRNYFKKPITPEREAIIEFLIPFVKGMNPGELSIETLDFLVKKNLSLNSATFFSHNPLLDSLTKLVPDLNRVRFLLKHGANPCHLFNPEIHPDALIFLRNILSIPKQIEPGKLYLKILAQLKEWGAVFQFQAPFEDSVAIRLLQIEGITNDRSFLIYCTEFLQKNGFHLLLTDQNGDSMLSWAIRSNLPKRKALIQNLLNLNCPVARTNHSSRSPFYYALESEDLPTARLLISKGSKDYQAYVNNQSHLAILLNDNPYTPLDEIETCIIKGSKINIQMGASKETPLIFAIKRGRRDLIKKLLMISDVDLNIQDSFGKTALSYAFDAGNAALMCELLQRGAKPNDSLKADQNPKLQGESQLIWAARKENEPLLKLLLEKGANINQQNRIGQTLLHYFVNEQLHEWVSFVLHLQASPNVADSDGNTPLMLAIRKQSPHSQKIVSMLLTSGAKTFLLNEEGQAPIDFAFCFKAHFFIEYQLSTCSLGKRILQDHPQVGKWSKEQIAQYLISLFGPVYSDEQVLSHQPILEAALALNLPSVSKALANHLISFEFANVLVSVLTANPSITEDYWLNHIVELDKRHFEFTVNELSIPIAPHADIRAIIEMFDAINTEHPEKPDYINPVNLYDGEYKRQREEVRNKLVEFIESVLERKPKKTIDNLEQYYNTISNLLQHITIMCQKTQDLRQRAHILIDIAHGGAHCTTRWISMPLDLYNMCRLHLQLEPVCQTFEAYIYSELMKLRLGIVEKMSGHNAHDRVAYMQILGVEANLPGGALLSQYVDNVVKRAPLDKLQTINRFYGYYRPAKLCRFALNLMTEKHREDNAQLKGDYSSVLAWFQNHPNRDWPKQKVYKELEEKARMYLTMPIPARRQQMLESLLARKEIIRNGKESHHDAIKRWAFDEYMEEEIYSDFYTNPTPKMLAGLHLLSTLQVITPMSAHQARLVFIELEKKLDGTKEGPPKKKKT